MATTTMYFPLENNENDRKARLVAWIVTGTIGLGLILFAIFYQILIKIPAIPPDPEVISLEIGLTDGTGGDAEIRGGGSQGNTGEPGAPAQNDAASDVPKNPTSDGAVTGDNPDNPSKSNSNGTNTSASPTVSADVAAALANWNKNKGKATIKIGGQGNGDPYTGGLGDGSGSDRGPGNGGDPGTGGNGGADGDANSGKNIRHIVFKPDIVNPTQEEGIVVVVLHVNRAGDVTKTEIGAGGTTSNSILQSVAAQSAYKIKLNPNSGAPVDQAIAIEIKFTLR